MEKYYEADLYKQISFFQQLKAKFEDFKHRVETGSERYRQCEDLAQKLISNESPYSNDIKTKQLQLQ